MLINETITRKVKIGEHEMPFVVDKEICEFQIAVYDVEIVKLLYNIHGFNQNKFCCIRVRCFNSYSVKDVPASEKCKRSSLCHGHRIPVLPITEKRQTPSRNAQWSPIAYGNPLTTSENWKRNLKTIIFTSFSITFELKFTSCWELQSLLVLRRQWKCEISMTFNAYILPSSEPQFFLAKL